MKILNIIKKRLRVGIIPTRSLNLYSGVLFDIYSFVHDIFGSVLDLVINVRKV